MLTILYGIFSVIGGIAMYTSATDGVSHPVVTMALGLSLGTHLAVFIKFFIRDFR